MEEKVRSTTILCVRRGDETVIASDGQVTLGNMVAKGTAKKIRSFQKGKILAGFAGSVADCMTLLDRLEKKLDQYEDLMRSCYELAKEWRTDKYIRNLEASLIITDGKMILSMSGDGNVLEPENTNIASVGSGSVFAISAARALYENTNLSAEEIVKKAMHIAGEMCIYTNHHLSLEKINTKTQKDEQKREVLKKEGLFKKKSKKEGKKK
jgi:ATP-dependent HslUV protease subunit HslV